MASYTLTTHAPPPRLIELESIDGHPRISAEKADVIWHLTHAVEVPDSVVPLVSLHNCSIPAMWNTIEKGINDKFTLVCAHNHTYHGQELGRRTYYDGRVPIPGYAEVPPLASSGNGPIGTGADQTCTAPPPFVQVVLKPGTYTKEDLAAHMTEAINYALNKLTEETYGWNPDLTGVYPTWGKVEYAPHVNVGYSTDDAMLPFGDWMSSRCSISQNTPWDQQTPPAGLTAAVTDTGVPADASRGAPTWQAGPVATASTGVNLQAQESIAGLPNWNYEGIAKGGTTAPFHGGIYAINPDPRYFPYDNIVDIPDWMFESTKNNGTGVEPTQFSIYMSQSGHQLSHWQRYMPRYRALALGFGDNFGVPYDRMADKYQGPGHIQNGETTASFNLAPSVVWDVKVEYEEKTNRFNWSFGENQTNNWVIYPFFGDVMDPSQWSWPNGNKIPGYEMEYKTVRYADQSLAIPNSNELQNRIEKNGNLNPAFTYVRTIVLAPGSSVFLPIDFTRANLAEELQVQISAAITNVQNTEDLWPLFSTFECSVTINDDTNAMEYNFTSATVNDVRVTFLTSPGWTHPDLSNFLGLPLDAPAPYTGGAWFAKDTAGTLFPFTVENAFTIKMEVPVKGYGKYWPPFNATRKWKHTFAPGSNALQELLGFGSDSNFNHDFFNLDFYIKKAGVPGHLVGADGEPQRAENLTDGDTYYYSRGGLSSDDNVDYGAIIQYPHPTADLNPHQIAEVFGRPAAQLFFVNFDDPITVANLYPDYKGNPWDFGVGCQMWGDPDHDPVVPAVGTYIKGDTDGSQYQGWDAVEPMCNRDPTGEDPSNSALLAAGADATDTDWRPDGRPRIAALYPTANNVRYNGWYNTMVKVAEGGLGQIGSTPYQFNGADQYPFMSIVPNYPEVKNRSRAPYRVSGSTVGACLWYPKDEFKSVLGRTANHMQVEQTHPTTAEYAGSPYELPNFDTLNVRSICVHTSMAGAAAGISSRTGSSGTMVCTIPVPGTVKHGQRINHSGMHHVTMCGFKHLKHIEVALRDTRGNLINVHGSPWDISFVISFVPQFPRYKHINSLHRRYGITQPHQTGSLRQRMMMGQQQRMMMLAADREKRLKRQEKERKKAWDTAKDNERGVGSK